MFNISTKRKTIRFGQSLKKERLVCKINLCKPKTRKGGHNEGKYYKVLPFTYNISKYSE